MRPESLDGRRLGRLIAMGLAVLGLVVVRTVWDADSDGTTQPAAVPSPAADGTPSSQDSSPSGALRSARGVWTLSSGTFADGSIAAVEGHPMTLVEEREGVWRGNDGCNELRLEVVTDPPGTWEVTELLADMMLCDSEEVMETGDDLQAALAAVDAQRESDTELVLTGPDTELRFTRSDTDTGSG